MKAPISLKPLFFMLIGLLLLDYIWLGLLIDEFIIYSFGSLITVTEGGIQFNLVAGLIVWFLIAFGVYWFAVRTSKDWKTALRQGALFGFVLYGVYDLTNLAFLNGYSLTFTIIDIIWGTFLCSVLALIGFYTKK